MKQLMEEKRNLQKTIERKSKEIEELNLKVQQMQGFHKRAIDKLDSELDDVKAEHSKWLERQQKETEEWHGERNELNQKIEQLHKNIHDIKKVNTDK